jgi:hypothetical protein
LKCNTSSKLSVKRESRDLALPNIQNKNRVIHNITGFPSVNPACPTQAIASEAKTKTPQANTGEQKPKTVEVTPEQSQRFEQIMQLSKGGDKTQAAQSLRELKVEMEPEQYQVLQKQYLAAQRGNALRTTTQPEEEFSGSSSKLSSHPEEMFAGHLDLMLPTDKFSINAQHRELLEGYYDVIAHGNPRKISIDTMEPKLGVNHRTLAKILEHRPDYNGECIRMLSCSTGALPDGFAQNLSNKMNKDVLAPSDLLWFGEKGESAISEMQKIVDPLTGEMYTGPKVPYTGEWRKFKPGENR